MLLEAEVNDRECSSLGSRSLPKKEASALPSTLFGRGKFKPPLLVSLPSVLVHHEETYVPIIWTVCSLDIAYYLPVL